MVKSERTCPECESILKDGVCLNCGYVENPVKPDLSKVSDSESQDDVNLELEKEEESPETSEPVVAENTEVKSIFADMVKRSDEDYSVEEKSALPSGGLKAIVFPAILALILFLIAGASYYLFVYASPEFVSPLVLSTQDIKEQKEVSYTEDNINEIPLTNLTDTEKTLELTSNLVEGNLAKYDFAQFAAPGAKLFFETFDIINILEIFDGADLFADLKEGFDFDDDDARIYLSEGFGMMYPESDLNQWGFVISVNDEEFVSERVDQFNDEKDVQKGNYKYADYFVELIEIKPESPAEPELAEEPEQTEESDVEEETVEPEQPSEFYLLISNSNEYLDQMVESSEGNLNNLADELQYVQSRVDLPKIGEFYAYKSTDSSVWNIFADYVSSKYEYEGLNKILQNLTSRGLVIYTNANKLKIVGSTN